MSGDLTDRDAARHNTKSLPEGENRLNWADHDFSDRSHLWNCFYQNIIVGTCLQIDFTQACKVLSLKVLYSKVANACKVAHEKMHSSSNLHIAQLITFSMKLKLLSKMPKSGFYTDFQKFNIWNSHVAIQIKYFWSCVTTKISALSGVLWGKSYYLQLSLHQLWQNTPYHYCTWRL